MSGYFPPGGSGGGAVDSVNGLTGAVVLDAGDVGAPRVMDTITGLTGGAASDLDNLATAAGLYDDALVVLFISGVKQEWLLEDGTDAESEAGGIVRPDDYAASTNEKIWVRKS